ncbi:MAG: YciI family protein, partial [Pseudomonadota bacterium]
EHQSFADALKAAGALVSGEALSDSREARTLRIGGDVQDGPYADTKEQLGGFYVIEAPDIESALDWARKCPVAKSGSIEVRPILDLPG